ncbi:MAG: ornithine cyclodeaminase family protein [Alphaproteobacteria bacterium]
MAKVEFLFLNRAQVEALVPPMAEVVDIVEAGLAAHGRGDVVLPPKAHIHLDDRYNGHFNILPGYAGPMDTAGVKVVGDYVDNWKHGLPSEVGMLTLYDPRVGTPRCLMDATVLTWLRTGAVTGVGARHLARRDATVLGHIGARGSAFSNIAAVAASFALTEVRIASARPETRAALATRVEAELGIPARPVENAAAAARGAHIVVEASRLEVPEVLVPASAIGSGALLVSFGWIMAVDPALATDCDKMVVDDWAQCTKGGTFHTLIENGDLTREMVHAEIGEIAAGDQPGRQSDDERITFWHRGFAISDIVLGHHIYERARADDVGTMLKLWEDR